MAFSRLYKLMAMSFPYMKKQAFVSIHPAILPTVTYIENHYMENDPISTYAKLCHISESRLFHLFSKSMGCTMIEFRNRLRIHHASDLLSDTNYSIEHISLQLGFESPEYFRRVFKKQLGISPSMYRKERQ